MNERITGPDGASGGAPLASQEPLRAERSTPSVSGRSQPRPGVRAGLTGSMLSAAVSPGAPAPLLVESDVAYRAETEGYSPALNTLDIHWAPFQATSPRRPVVVFIHGGNWSAGDKSGFGESALAPPGWFVNQGCVFVSINFRLPGNPRSPDATMSDALDDIAKALKWLTVNARRFGGVSTGFVLLGHSSGAHLAALLVSDASYLKRYRLSPADVRGVIAQDVPHYDLPMAMAILEKEGGAQSNQSGRLAALYKLFSASPEQQARYSPAAHIGPWLRDTAFLILSAGRHQGRPQTFSQRMSEHYAQRLSDAGVSAEHCHFDGLDHGDFIHSVQREVADRYLRFLASVRAQAPSR